jgi:hypothetical protein
MKRKKVSNLVCQYLENISRKALEKYQGIIKKYVRGRHGVYALYRKNKLYYVGLASNLRSRLRHHLRDRHAQTWNSFSVYLTVGDQHLHELETLLLRIIKPRGNVQKGKFENADDLRKRFRKDIAKAQSIELEELFCGGTASKGVSFKKNLQNIGIKGRRPILAPFVDRRFHIRFRYKGKLYIAHVRRDGSITFAKESAESDRLQGKVFMSPSLAASAVTKHTMNGWTAWKYERAPGDWVLLNELRK